VRQANGVVIAKSQYNRLRLFGQGWRVEGVEIVKVPVAVTADNRRGWRAMVLATIKARGPISL